MDFNARQYDPQIARFLSVDPKAAAGGQEIYSPYAAMGNEPESMIDPNGEAFGSFSSSGMRGLSGMGLLGGFYNSQTVIDMLGMIGSYVGSSGKIDPDFTSKFDEQREYERRMAAAGQNYGLGLYQLAVANYSGNFSAGHMLGWYDGSGDDGNEGTLNGPGKPEVLDETVIYGSRNTATDPEQIVEIASTHVDDFDGFWGKVKWVFNNGRSGNGNYDWDGNFRSLNLSVTGMPPTEVGFSGVSIFKVAKGGNALIKTGVEISGHAAQRMAQRGITNKMVETGINKGLKFFDPKNNSVNYVLRNGFASGKDLLIGTNPLTGRITTVIPGRNLINSRFIPIK